MFQRRRRPIDDRDVIVEREVIRDDGVHATNLEHHEARMSWSPAQFVAIIIGIGFMVFGAIAVVRGGVSALDTHVSVAGFHHTQLLGWVHIGFGLLMLLGGVSGSTRGFIALLGAVAVAFGLVVLIEPTDLHTLFGTHPMHGWTYIAVGAVALLAGLMFPAIENNYGSTHRRRYFDRR